MSKLDGYPVLVEPHSLSHNHSLNVNRSRLLFIVGSKVLGRMSVTVECTTLNGTVLENARRYGSSGACAVWDSK